MCSGWRSARIAISFGRKSQDHGGKQMSDEQERAAAAPENGDGIEYVLNQKCCKDVQKPRLRIGQRAKVTSKGDGLRLRKAPGLGGEEILGMTKGTRVDIECGPVCVNKIVWWRVKHGTQRGWSAEGEKGEGYYLKQVFG
jgi:hypothetical protein